MTEVVREARKAKRVIGCGKYIVCVQAGCEKLYMYDVRLLKRTRFVSFWRTYVCISIRLTDRLAVEYKKSDYG